MDEYSYCTAYNYHTSDCGATFRSGQYRLLDSCLKDESPIQEELGH